MHNGWITSIMWALWIYRESKLWCLYNHLSIIRDVYIKGRTEGDDNRGCLLWGYLSQGMSIIGGIYDIGSLLKGMYFTGCVHYRVCLIYWMHITWDIFGLLIIVFFFIIRGIFKRGVFCTGCLFWGVYYRVLL